MARYVPYAIYGENIFRQQVWEPIAPTEFDFSFDAELNAVALIRQ